MTMAFALSLFMHVKEEKQGLRFFHINTSTFTLNVCMYGHVHTYICIYTYIRERNGGSDKSTMEKLFLILIRDQTEIFIIDPKIKLTSKIFCKHYSVFSFIYLVIGWQQTCWWLVYSYTYLYICIV